MAQNDLGAAFEKAQVEVKTLKKRPSNEQLGLLYAYFKQATIGDIVGKRPGLLDMVGRYKYDAWKKCERMTADDAMSHYCDLVSHLLADPHLN